MTCTMTLRNDPRFYVRETRGHNSEHFPFNYITAVLKISCCEQCLMMIGPTKATNLCIIPCFIHWWLALNTSELNSEESCAQNTIQNLKAYLYETP